VLRIADKKITLLGSAITDLPNTSIALPQENSSHAPFSLSSELSATQNKKLLQSSVWGLLEITSVFFLDATAEPTHLSNTRNKR
jgi:hypothetical protein